MEEDKKKIIIDIPGEDGENGLPEQPQMPKTEFSPVPEITEELYFSNLAEMEAQANNPASVSPEVPVETPEPPKPEKPKKEKIKLNKLNSILSFAFIAMLVVMVILCLLQFTNVDFSRTMWLGINGTLSDFNYSVMQYVPFLSSIGLYILMGVFIIVLLIDIIFLVKYKNDLESKTKFQNKIMPYLIVVSFIMAINCYFLLSEASHRGINEMYMKSNLHAEYTEEDLTNVIDYFKNRIVTYAETLNRKNGKIEMEKTPYDMAIDDLKNVSFKYEFLKGSYPSKIRTLSDFDLMTSGYPVGLTYNYTVALDDINLTNLNKIYVLTHEFCHVKGIVRESDADYCAFLAGFNSNNDISKYAMFLNLLPSFLSIVKDKSLARTTVDDFGNICLESGYDEICNLYFKDLNRFISGSDTLVLNTYSLDIYKDKKDQLKQYILGLKNRLNVSFEDEEGHSKSIEDVNKMIDEAEKQALTITGNINKDSYNKNLSYLRTMSDYFPHLYLKNSKEKEEDYSNFNYLKPFNTKDNYSTLTAEAPEYSYERAIRSVLEYFSQYVFN